VCRTLRNRDERLPIIMLTARSEETDIVVGLDAGADDYITKPFRLAELLARVRVRLRLATPRAAGPVQGVSVDPEAHRAWHDEVELDLTPKEFDVLSLLVLDAGRVVARQRLMQEVWDEHYFGSTRTLDMHISSLRKKLGDDPTNPRLITTVRGVGFRFETG
jgi:DNA-binding response OmpR family regulator